MTGRLGVLQLAARLSPGRLRFAAALNNGRNLLRLPVDIQDGKAPERHQIDSGNELSKEGRQKLPVPAKKVRQSRAHAEIKHIVSRRLSALDE